MTDDPLGPRVFSIEEANSLVPELNDRVGELIQEHATIRELARMLYLQTKEGPVEEGAFLLDIGPQDNDPPEVHALKRDLSSRLGKYHHGWEHIEDLGAVVKDMESGLIDFYGRIDNRLVCLCWKYGEAQIDHYHDLDSGFDGRKPLIHTLRERMLN